MSQSTRTGGAGLHVGIIMDGNGRWAEARGRAREWGHRQGAKAVRAIVEAAPDLGVGTLTLYAFSSDNWQRPEKEVRSLMSLFRRYLHTESAALAENGVRLSVIGRRDRLAPDLLRAIEAGESMTAEGKRLLLRLAVDYSSRHTLLEAARACRALGTLDRDTFERHLAVAMHATQEGTPDVDLLIRTGGEQRLSDFLLWECAYAELVFTPRMWPDFRGEDLAAAVREFHARDRRFGRVQAVV
jgi:undecaprenyl diphosphate synthase